MSWRDRVLTVWEHEAYESSSEWDYAAIVTDESGRFYTAYDGGCSCNGPWDGIGEADLTPQADFSAAMADVMKWASDSYYADPVEVQESLLEYKMRRGG